MWVYNGGRGLEQFWNRIPCWLLKYLFPVFACLLFLVLLFKWLQKRRWSPPRFPCPSPAVGRRRVWRRMVSCPRQCQPPVLAVLGSCLWWRGLPPSAGMGSKSWALAPALMWPLLPEITIDVVQQKNKCPSRNPKLKFYPFTFHCHANSGAGGNFQKTCNSPGVSQKKKIGLCGDTNTAILTAYLLPRYPLWPAGTFR